jgi:hypothetical protein
VCVAASDLHAFTFGVTWFGSKKAKPPKAILRAFFGEGDFSALG